MPIKKPIITEKFSFDNFNALNIQVDHNFLEYVRLTILLLFKVPLVILPLLV